MPIKPPFQQIKVDLPQRSYAIHIGSGLLKESSTLQGLIDGSQVMVVSDENVAKQHRDKLNQLLSHTHIGKSLQVDWVILPPGETTKTLNSMQNIYTELAIKKHHRTTTIIAFGGGIVGDVAGFVAATWQRGVDYIQIPTTLVSQVDSAVGGKTGINLEEGKNLVGAFYQPKAVISDIDMLTTLPPRELYAGYAEVVKYALIDDAEFFGWLEVNSEALISLSPSVLSEAIGRSCQIKARLVAEDETEQGIRALLNFGHTFGHALEQMTHYQTYLHGEAVAIGMVMAAKFSVAMGWLAKEDIQQIIRLLEKFNLSVDKPSQFSASQWLEVMAMDKKVRNKKLRFILLRAIGTAVIHEVVDTTLLCQQF